VIVLAAGAELTTQAVIDHCADQLARFKVPTSVVFAPSLPRSANGEVMRRRLRGA